LKQKADKAGWPRFKSRRKGIGSFRLVESIHISEGTIQLPRMGTLRLKERGYLPAGAKVSQATVSERAGRWYVSIQIEQECPDTVTGSGPALGIDLGIKALATCSDGSQYPNPKALHSSLKRLKRCSRQVSRKVKGSQNREKARRRLATLHARIAHVRQEVLHQTTTAIVTKAKSQQARCLVIEDLNVTGMMRNRKLSRAIADVGMFEFKRQILYKSEAVGLPVEIVSRWYPSSKTCSGCGWVDDSLTLKDRMFRCQQCNLVLDRDMNAAINLASTASYAGNTPVEIDALASRKRGVKRRSLKQEPDTNVALVATG
jgi:putative transposase